MVFTYRNSVVLIKEGGVQSDVADQCSFRRSGTGPCCRLHSQDDHVIVNLSLKNPYYYQYKYVML